MQSPMHGAIVGVTSASSDKIAGAPSARGQHVFEIGFNPVGDQSLWPALQGPHNAQNAAAAIGACVKLGLEVDAIVHGLSTFPGLPHRMERIREKDGVTFVNDSKATNPTATAPALAAFERIRWICGGQAQSRNFRGGAPEFGNGAS